MKENTETELHVKREERLKIFAMFLAISCLVVWASMFMITDVVARNGPSKHERVEVVDRYIDYSWVSIAFGILGHDVSARYNLRLVGADQIEFVRKVPQRLYRAADASRMARQGIVLEARRSMLLEKPTVFQFVRDRTGPGGQLYRQVMRTYDLSFPPWIVVYMIFLSGVTIVTLRRFRNVMKAKKLGPEYYPLSYVYHSRVIGGCLLASMMLGIVMWPLTR